MKIVCIFECETLPGDQSMRDRYTQITCQSALYFLFFLFFIISYSCKQPAKLGSQKSETEAARTNEEVIPDNLLNHDTISLFKFISDVRVDAEKDLAFYDQSNKVLRYREVQINPLLTDLRYLQTGQRILLGLFDDIKYVAEITSLEKNASNTLTIKALLFDHDEYFVLSTHFKRSLGTLSMPLYDRHYQIISHPETYSHYLIEIRFRSLDIIEDM